MSIDAVHGHENPDQLYHGVFELSDSFWDYDRIVDAMFKLVGRTYASDINDPRRVQVRYWIEAENDASKCTLEDHQELMARLDSDRAKAKETKRGLHSPSERDDIFKLADYVNGLIARRFKFCQTTVGYAFSQSFHYATLGDLVDLDDLTANNNWISDKDPKQLGEKVARLLKRKLDRSTLMQSKSADSIQDSYNQVSPCKNALKVVKQYESYYRLLALPGNYEKCVYSLPEVLDKISVCEFIQRSRQVFEYAVDYVR